MAHEGGFFPTSSLIHDLSVPFLNNLVLTQTLSLRHGPHIRYRTRQQHSADR
jgi:hypothetical protein